MIKWIVTTLLLLILIRLFGYQMQIVKVDEGSIYNYSAVKKLTKEAKQIASDVLPAEDQDNISEDTSNGAKPIASGDYKEIMEK